MTILLYDHIELEDRAAKKLKAWKVWHLILFAIAAIFGIVNFVFLQNTMQLVDENCVLFPRKLEFHWVDLPIPLEESIQIDNAHDRVKSSTEPTDPAQDKVSVETDTTAPKENNALKENNATIEDNATNEDAKKVKREVNDDDENEPIIQHDENGTAITGNSTHRLMLDTSRTLFENDSDCEFAEFMPILSTIFACVWITFFTMCPGGGHSRTGLQQPWRILTPALVFAIVMVGLTGHSFTITNKGLHAFCAGFSQFTNSTTCSSVNPFLERGWNASWGLGQRVASTRAASAGVLAAWAVAAVILLVRCLSAPDFVVKRTGVYLTKDPQQKILPHLKKSRSKQSRTSNSPTKRDTISVRSEPTVTTELVSASVEQGHDSAPSSLMATPVRRNPDIEMAYSEQETLPAASSKF